MHTTIAKGDFQKVVHGLLDTLPMIAPVELPHGELLYEHIQKVEDVSLTSGIPTISAKEFFFAREEELFRFKQTCSEDIEFIPPAEPKETVFLGIRSCDLKGVRFLEQFFQKQFNDMTVTKKIEKTIFISMGCVDPEEHCFCVCCDGGPFLTDGYDAQMMDFDDKWLIEIATQKAEKLFRPYMHFFTPATEIELSEKKDILSNVDTKFVQRSYMAMGVKKISLNTVQDEVWQKLGDRCIGCGSCVYVCPTCSCFNVYDRKTADEGVRIRTWDACNYSGFTREVSGHNPRPQASDRLKRRYFHKLSYQTMKNNGRLGCVGCGRCVASCPSLVDMSTFVTTLRSDMTG